MVIGEAEDAGSGEEAAGVVSLVGDSKALVGEAVGDAGVGVEEVGADSVAAASPGRVGDEGVHACGGANWPAMITMPSSGTATLARDDEDPG